MEDVVLIKIMSNDCTISLEVSSRVKIQLLWLSSLNFAILYKNSVMFNVEVRLVKVEFENEKFFGEVEKLSFHTTTMTKEVLSTSVMLVVEIM